MEPIVGFEPTTCSLRVSCSTPEPYRHAVIPSYISMKNGFRQWENRDCRTPFPTSNFFDHFAHNELLTIIFGAILFSPQLCTPSTVFSTGILSNRPISSAFPADRTKYSRRIVNKQQTPIVYITHFSFRFSPNSGAIIAVSAVVKP